MCAPTVAPPISFDACHWLVELDQHSHHRSVMEKSPPGANVWTFGGIAFKVSI